MAQAETVKQAEEAPPIEFAGYRLSKRLARLDTEKANFDYDFFDDDHVLVHDGLPYDPVSGEIAVDKVAGNERYLAVMTEELSLTEEELTAIRSGKATAMEIKNQKKQKAEEALSAAKGN